jgi:hypothetical protein
MSPLRWPTEWKSKERPCFPVTKEIIRDEEGIHYTVVVTDESICYENGDDQYIVWDRFVAFNALNHSGGPAFQGASEEQERVADAWVRAIQYGGLSEEDEFFSG